MNSFAWMLLLGAGLVGPVVAAEADWVAQARGVASAVPPKLLEVLKAEIDKGGPAGAIEACKDQAPQLARAASERSGWQVRRVSLKNRNPKAVPDAWEQLVLQEFDRRAAAGDNPATLERAEEVVNAQGRAERRFMRALPVQELCLNCHGPAANLSAPVLERLRALYPDDQGVGYSVGQVRGAMTLRQPAP
ncbi:Protein of unknown function (DUF3365) [Burkholderiales bacterium JOSHI_001]|nr:Protein of unknown function (DUF3365) [Burkholderiales bacterium JOSHI_001]